jgi:PAS domain-containing protein
LLGDTIYNTSLDATYIIDMEKNIVVDCNKRALKLFGFTDKEQILHSPVVTVLGTETDQRIKSFSKDNFVRHSPWFGNMEFIRKDRTSIYAYAKLYFFT